MARGPPAIAAWQAAEKFKLELPKFAREIFIGILITTSTSDCMQRGSCALADELTIDLH